MFGRKRDEPHDTTTDTSTGTTRAAHVDDTHGRHEGEPVTRGEVLDREREEHGGIKIGSAFFGWLAATGMVVLLSAVITATGLIAGDATDTDTPAEAAGALDLSAAGTSRDGWRASTASSRAWPCGAGRS
jgi:hypothetical protein